MRKTAILHSANRHFATHGFRGASLRDIARDASVSLTLLNHHFGSKFDLLCAVIDAHREVLDERVSLIRDALRPGAAAPTLDALLGDWVRAAFRVATDADGLTFLRLLVRVIDDPEAEAAEVVRERLEDAAQAFIDALLRLHPAASRRAAAMAYLCVTAALLKYVTSPARVGQLAPEAAPETADAEQARLVRFLAAGAQAALAD